MQLCGYNFGCFYWKERTDLCLLFPGTGVGVEDATSADCHVKVWQVVAQSGTASVVSGLLSTSSLPEVRRHKSQDQLEDDEHRHCHDNTRRVQANLQMKLSLNITVFSQITVFAM